MLGGSGFASILIIIAYVVLLIIMLMTNTLISINYTFDLKFGSFFKFKEIFSNLRKHSGTVLLYLIKMLIIGIIVASFIGAIAFIGQVPFYSIKDIPSNLMKNSMLIQQVFYLAFVPFFINLSGQLGAILFAKKIEAIKAKIMQKKNAKMMAAKKEA